MTEAFIAAEKTPAERSNAAPLLGLATLDPQEGGDTWMTVGDPHDPEEELTVTVVFRRDPLDDFDTGEYLLRPLAPQFPGRG